MVQDNFMTLAETARLISGYLDTAVKKRQIIIWTITASLPRTFSIKGLGFSEDQVYAWLDNNGEMLDSWADNQDMPMSMDLNQVTRYLNLYRIGKPLTAENVLEWAANDEIPHKKTGSKLSFNRDAVNAWIDALVKEQEAEGKKAKKKPAAKAKASAKKTAKKAVKKKTAKKK